MKRILITNDDGITASGIIRLAEAALAWGEVCVIAPESQRSAQSHAITLREPLELHPHDFPVPHVHAWACSGTPSDCVRVGLAFLMDAPPDAVLSGINFGYNMASDVQYSATVGAALEAAHRGIPGIAFSEPADVNHQVTDKWLPQILESVLTEKFNWDEIINVNFPHEFCHGILRDRKLSAGSMFQDGFQRMERFQDGGVKLSTEGLLNFDCEEGTDFRALMDHYISIGRIRNLHSPNYSSC